MFPVSAAMLKNPALYDHSLEAFSNPLMQLVDYDLDDLGQMTLQGESGAFYRYIDMTVQAEAMYDFVKLTIEHDLKRIHKVLTQPPPAPKAQLVTAHSAQRIRLICGQRQKTISSSQ